jgi:hypothetical protein
MMLSMMSKKALGLALAASAFAMAAPFASAQSNPRGEAKITLGGKAVVIDYGRPSLRGRDMIGQLEVGKSWRMGADSATTLKTEADLTFGALSVPKGSYVLTLTKAAADKWVLNVKEGDKTIADIPLLESKAAAPVESLTIELKGEKAAGEFQMSWGTLVVKAPFGAK